MLKEIKGIIMECLYHGRFSNFVLGFVNSFAESIPLALLHNQKAIPIPIPVSCRDKTKIDFI